MESLNTTIAHSVLYRNLASTNSNIPACEEGACEVTLHFKWLGEDLCRSNVLCSKLDQNPCEDFGITLEYPDSKAVLCRANQLHQGTLAFGQTFSASVWYTEDSIIDWECYFWCTEDGNLPVKHHDGTASDDHIIQLVPLLEHYNCLYRYGILYGLLQLNGTSNLENVLPVTLHQPIITSVAKVYHIRLTSDALGECNETKCYTRQTFGYFGASSCRGNLICSTLTGNPCGDYQLSSRFHDESQNVCYEGVLYTGDLQDDQDFELSFWRTEEAVFEMSCFFWCTSQGDLPQRRSDNISESGDTILQVVRVSLCNDANVAIFIKK